MESLKSSNDNSVTTNKKLEYYELLRIGELALNVLSNHRANENTLDSAQSLLQSILEEFETQVDALTPVSSTCSCHSGLSWTDGTTTISNPNSGLLTPSVGFTVSDYPWATSITTSTGTNSNSSKLLTSSWGAHLDDAVEAW